MFSCEYFKSFKNSFFHWLLLSFWWSNSSVLGICRHSLLIRWLPRLRKLKSSKKVESLQVALALRVASWKNIVFYDGGKKRRFFIIFTSKLSSAALNYLNAHSTLNFIKTLTQNQTSNEQNMTFYKKQPLILGAAVERCSGSERSDLQFYFTGVFEEFGHVFPIFSKKSTKIFKVGKIFRD